jgi:protein O-GlcNAc transferase
MSNTDQPGNVEEIAEGNAEAIAASQLEASLLFELLRLQGRLRCIDCGALKIEGTQKDPWIVFAEAGLAEVIGFEPISEECERLNATCGFPESIRYLPYAIGDGARHTLNITNLPMTSSLFEPDTDTLDLFHNLGEFTQVVARESLQTMRLDDLADLGPIDFLKLDIQGAELMALQNATSVLANTSVIQCEVEFVELYKGQPLFADVDSFLRSQGFCFLKFAYTMGRPFKPLLLDDNPNRQISQTLWADAVFVKDFRLRHQWEDRILQSSALILHKFYQGFDLARLLIQELDRRHGTVLVSEYLSFFLGIQDHNPSV